MKLRVTLAFGYYRKGDLIDPPALQAENLLALRCMGMAYVERVIEPPPTPTATAVAPEPSQPPAPPPEPEKLPPPRRKGRDLS